MIKKQYFITFFCCLLLLSGIRAQPYRLQIQKIGLEDGLSSYNITGFLQDNRGFLWIATDYGLNRYDGLEMKTYTKEENGLCSNHLTSLFKDNKGNVWVVALESGGGYCYSILNPITEKFSSIQEHLGIDLPFDPESIQVSFSFHENSILFYDESVEEHGGLYYEYDGTKIEQIFKQLDFRQKYPNHSPRMHKKLGEDTYVLLAATQFIASKEDVSFLLNLNKEGKIKSTFYCPPSFYLSAIQPISPAAYCVTCIDVFSDPNIHTVKFFPSSKEELPFLKMRQDRGENLIYVNERIYSISSDWLRIFDKNGNLLKETASSLTLNRSGNNFFVDRNENFWISNDQFLYKISVTNQAFDLELSNQIPPFKIRGIEEDHKGNLITGGLGFFIQKTEENWVMKAVSKLGVIHNTLGLLKDENGIWVGLEEHGLLYYDRNLVKTSLYKAPTYIQLVWQPYRSKTGKIWVGTSSGLYYVDKDQKILLPFDTLGPLMNSMVYAFYENAAGAWLSTSSGLFLVDLEQQKVLACYNNEQTGAAYLPTRTIGHLVEDKKTGFFWLATKGDGLIKWHPQTKEWKQFTKKGAGLSHNHLHGIYEDDFGNLWLSSQRGLMRFNKETEHVQVFLEEDGLPHNEFNTISHYKSPNGRLYFGGQNGMVHFDPKDFQLEATPGAFIITEYCKRKYDSDTLLHLTAEILENETIRLYSDDKLFRLSMALLDFNNTKNHQYCYQIVGYDKGWNYLSQNSFEINNLPYGEYELKLRAKAANSSDWINYPKGIKILVLKPFYLQNWFLLLSLSMVVGLIYALFRWRIKRLEENKIELEVIIKERTAKIESAKKVIEEDKRKIEEQAAELKALDKVKSRFFANISHELRTPLTLILGPLSYILNNEESWEKATVQKQLLTMDRNGKNLMGLIEEILDLSKLEANKLELLEEITPVKAFFEHLYAPFEVQLSNKKMDTQLSFDLKDDYLNVLLDRKKLEKVFNNFMSNAIKFTPNIGSIYIQVIEKEASIELSVRDSGEGIHPDDLPHVFERFYQSKLAERKLYGGTGIGLALVSEFATLMKGKVSVESNLNKGSKFCFEFPKKEVSIQRSIPRIEAAELYEEVIENIGTDFTILVVEDNDDMRAFISQVMGERYKEVLVAENGQEGLDIIQTRGSAIHLIVSDIMMPVMDGLSMLKAIKANPAWHGIPVIMLTALASERDKLTALTTGVDDYLTKPFSVTELLVRSQNLLFNYHQRLEWLQEEKEGKTLDLEDEKPSELEVEQSLTTAPIIPLLDKAWLEEAEKEIRGSLETGVVTVEELADKLFISKRQLTRKIKSYTGLTPSKFIRAIQLQQARVALEEGNFISLADLSLSCGFENQSTFSTLFKKHYGKTPRDFLKEA